MEFRADLADAPIMEVVDVLSQVRRQDLEVDQIATIGGERHISPHQKVRDLRVLHATHHVLDADAELTILVEAGLVTDAHTRDELDLAPTADALWTLVHIEARADAVPCPVLVVETDRPEGLAGKDIHVCSTDPAICWPDDAFELERAHQNSCVSLLLLLGWIATEVDRPRYVSGAVHVLTTRVEQVDLLVVESLGSLFLWLVMNDGAVSSDRRNRIETGLNEREFLFSEL